MKRFIGLVLLSGLIASPVLAAEATPPAAPKAAAKDAPKSATKDAPKPAASKPASSTASGDSSMELLRQKLKADKKLIVSINMDLSESEAKVFWPVYEAYQKDLQAVNQRIAKLVDTYTKESNAGLVPNEVAQKLVSDWLGIEASELELKRSYVPKLNKVLPAYKVARYVQIENKIRAVVKYELGAQIPLIE
jgi:hypothetical protein